MKILFIDGPQQGCVVEFTDRPDVIHVGRPGELYKYRTHLFCIQRRNKRTFGVVGMLGDPTELSKPERVACIRHTMKHPVKTQERKVDF